MNKYVIINNNPRFAEDFGEMPLILSQTRLDPVLFKVICTADLTFKFNSTKGIFFRFLRRFFQIRERNTFYFCR